MTESTVCWTLFARNDMELTLAASAKGLCLVAFSNECAGEPLGFLQERFPRAKLCRDDAELQVYYEQIDEYFRGLRSEFSLPLDMRGTPFQVSVWRALMQISYGKTCSYLDIAEAVGQPKAARAVGAATGRNPIPIIVPCHRVIGTNGTLTGFRGGLHLKETLLRLEGIDQYHRSGHARFNF